MNALQMRCLLVQNWLVPMGATHLASECEWPGRSAWTCDLLAVDRKGFLLEVEIKVSISDLRADAKKENKHGIYEDALDGQVATPPPPARFFYAVPFDLKREAIPIIREFFPYSGLLVVGPSPTSVKVVRGAKQLHFCPCEPSDQLFLEHASVRTIGRLLGSLAGRTR